VIGAVVAEAEERDAKVTGKCIDIKTLSLH